MKRRAPTDARNTSALNSRKAKRGRVRKAGGDQLPLWDVRARLLFRWKAPSTR